MSDLLGARQVGDDAGIRELLAKLDKLDKRMTATAAALGGVQALIAAQNDIQAQIDYLASQTETDEKNPGSVTTVTTNPATSSVPVTWRAFDANADASVTITTGSTGRIAVLAGGYMLLRSEKYAMQHGYIGVEVIRDGATVRAPLQGDGNMTSLLSDYGYLVNASSGQKHEWLAWANTTYTLRCRRGYSVDAGSAGAIAAITFQGTSISVSKLAM